MKNQCSVMNTILILDHCRSKIETAPAKRLLGEQALTQSSQCESTSFDLRV